MYAEISYYLIISLKSFLLDGLSDILHRSINRIQLLKLNLFHIKERFSTFKHLLYISFNFELGIRRGTYISACCILQILAWKLVRLPAMSNRSDCTQATLFLLEAQFIHAGPVLLLPFSPISPACWKQFCGVYTFYVTPLPPPWHFVFHIYHT